MQGTEEKGGDSTPRQHFPEQFLKGIALSVWQNSSDTASNWTEFAQRKNYFGQGTYKDAFLKANDFWTEYENDIKLMKNLGATSFRFSFEWARFAPDGPGQVDPSAVAKFHQILDCCEAYGLEPCATLFHFTVPQWFEARGGFAVEENLPLFVDYCTMVFQNYGHRIRLWATMNEPTCFAFVGYICGIWAPGKFLRLTEAGTVLCNLLKAHCAVYRALKELPGGLKACIGLVHQHIMFEPGSNWWHIRELCKWMTFWFGTNLVLDFFKTGTFSWASPFSSQVKTLHVDEGIKAGEVVVDWWGINYYSRPVMHWNFAMGASSANERVTDTNFRLHPQGLYDSIRDASALGVPMYITETGLADAKDQHREHFIRSHYSMILKAIHDGFDVRGVFFWTLMDNIEWHEGFRVKFGLYRWDPEYAAHHAGSNGRPPNGLELRKGALAHATCPDDLHSLRVFAAAHHHHLQVHATRPDNLHSLRAFAAAHHHRNSTCYLARQSAQSEGICCRAPTPEQ
ncbi:glycoside hydrolase superfamily [Dunaliella salina]|uniref:Glycoside hydrolase superfamily n=1 Tax=Dunaliella salina TaxID=3046 RepID=A0ABQ7G1Y2_DUNSA|nr:glycoside hydrolase superfamily [Dunaliella salina]|eukprot:KAF5828616.1 glycoside hydrolase superfamily [Dunaliella salina]